jgi:DNA-binding MarR family transcriptional regulator
MIINAKDLGATLGISQPDAQQILRTLERKGRIARVRDTKPKHNEGKLAYTYSLDESQLQTLRNLFDPPKEK